MKKIVADYTDLYVIGVVNLAQLAALIVDEYNPSMHTEIMQECLEYAEYHRNSYFAAGVVGTEVLIDTPYDTFKAFVEKSDGEWICVDRDGEKERYHVGKVDIGVVDMCDE